MTPARRVRISTLVTLPMSIGFPLLAAMFGGWSAVQVLQVIKAASGESPDAGMVAELGGRIILVVACALLGRITVRLKRVFLLSDRVQVLGWCRSADIPLSSVEEVVWIQRPERDLTPEAALRLRAPSVFGREIRFAPRSPSALESLCNAVSAKRG